MNGSTVNPRDPRWVADTILKVIVLTRRVALDRLGKASLRRIQGVDAGYREHSSSKSRTAWPHLPR